MTSAIVGFIFLSFVISWLLTAAMTRIAPAIGFVDRPGHRKIHVHPKPLGGGVAIFWAIALPMLAVVAGAHLVDFTGRGAWADYAGGVRDMAPLALTFIGTMFAMHVLGLVDDRRALGPYVKLIGQLLITAALVIPFASLRVLTAWDAAIGAHGALSVALTVFWIVAITNAFNFLDNMDGLSAGIAAVCGLAFFATAMLIGQYFVAANLALLVGAALGFLCFNFAPARIFMGDSGSLVLGYVLGVLTVRTQYLAPGARFGAGWYAVFAPVIVLAVPLYDLIVVSIIRLSRGKSPFVGDTNHFSHRLVARGMSRRTAVLCLYLITAATAVAAIILPYVQTTLSAILIFAQTLLILAVVALLEQHPLPAPPQAAPPQTTPTSADSLPRPPVVSPQQPLATGAVGRPASRGLDPN